MSAHTCGIQTFTPEEAESILMNDLFVRQRAPRSEHVAFLADTWRQGQFDGGAPIRFAQCAGKRHLVDGSHRLRMVRVVGSPVQFVTVTTECKTEEDVAALYSRIDRGRGRSIADAMKALGMHDDRGFSTTQLNLVMACSPIFSNDLTAKKVRGNQYASRSAEARSSIMERWFDAATLYFDAVAGSSDAHFFQRREAVAVGIATFSERPMADRADAFWRGMARDDGLRSTDPRKKCLEFMKKTKPNPHGVGLLAHGITTCWNAFYRDDELKMVKVMDVTGPLIIRGTRWAKRT